jgi:hypothetical protein
MLISNRFHPTIVFIICAAFLLAACSSQSSPNAANNGANVAGKTNANSENSTASKDDAAELNSMILLPFAPEETEWRAENDTKNPNAKKLVAVFKFAPDDAKNLTAQAAKHRAPEAVQIGTEDWFPAELIAQTQLSGDETLKGMAYGANDFLQMPYKSGRLIKVDNSNYFILEVSTN